MIPAVALRDVTLAFGGVAALTNVSFDVGAEEVVGLIGPNGAGKTSLLNCITGFYRCNSGTIAVDGHDVTSLRVAQINGLGVGRTFQQVESLSGLGAADVLLIGLHRQLPHGILKYAFRLPSVRRSEAEARIRILEIADRLGVLSVVERNQPLETLPYGVRKLLDLGRALAAKPKLLLTDEPAAGLSAEEKQTMADTLRQVAREDNLTQILIDHDVNFVTSVVDRLVVLDAGVLICDGVPGEVLKDPRVIESYIGPEDPIAFSGVPDHTEGDA